MLDFLNLATAKSSRRLKRCVLGVRLGACGVCRVVIPLGCGVARLIIWHFAVRNLYFNPVSCTRLEWFWEGWDWTELDGALDITLDIMQHTNTERKSEICTLSSLQCVSSCGWMTQLSGHFRCFSLPINLKENYIVLLGVAIQFFKNYHGRQNWNIEKLSSPPSFKFVVCNLLNWRPLRQNV